MKYTSVILLSCLVLTACEKSQQKLIGVVVDTSGSISSQTKQSFNAASENVVNSLVRGDDLYYLPIRSEAMLDISGKQIAVSIPVNRQPFDSDLIKARKDGVREITDLNEELFKSLSGHTDIFGTLQFLSEKMSGDSREHVIVVLTDGLEDEKNGIVFHTDKRLSGEQSAIDLANELATKHGTYLSNTKVYFGLITSNESSTLSKTRLLAIKAFWNCYLSKIGATPMVRSDGFDSLPAYVIREIGGSNVSR